MEEEKKIGCGKKLHYSIKCGGNMICGKKVDGNLYLCKKCKELREEDSA